MPPSYWQSCRITRTSQWVVTARMNPAVTGLSCESCSSKKEPKLGNRVGRNNAHHVFVAAHDCKEFRVNLKGGEMDLPDMNVEIPAHSHKAQWGTVLEGEVEVTIGGETRKYGTGSSYYIPAGVVHSARAPAGCKVIDFFEEPDRYRLR